MKEEQKSYCQFDGRQFAVSFLKEKLAKATMGCSRWLFVTVIVESGKLPKDCQTPLNIDL